jgi:hypothetical protein
MIAWPQRWALRKFFLILRGLFVDRGPEWTRHQSAPADEVGGLYCEDCPVAEPVEGAELRAGPRAYALDP